MFRFELLLARSDADSKQTTTAIVGRQMKIKTYYEKFVVVKMSVFYFLVHMTKRLSR